MDLYISRLYPIIVFSSSLNGVVESQESYSDDPTPPGGSVPEATPLPEEDAQACAASPSGPPLDQLKHMLSTQLEYYFSR